MAMEASASSSRKEETTSPGTGDQGRISVFSSGMIVSRTMRKLIFLATTAIVVAGCQSPSPQAGGGEDENETVMEAWTEEADRRRAEGQYMGYYSKPAYLRSKQRRSVRGGTGR